MNKNDGSTTCINHDNMKKISLEVCASKNIITEVLFKEDKYALSETCTSDKPCIPWYWDGVGFADTDGTKTFEKEKCKEVCNSKSECNSCISIEYQKGTQGAKSYRAISTKKDQFIKCPVVCETTGAEDCQSNFIHDGGDGTDSTKKYKSWCSQYTTFKEKDWQCRKISTGTPPNTKTTPSQWSKYCPETCNANKSVKCSAKDVSNGIQFDSTNYETSCLRKKSWLDKYGDHKGESDCWKLENLNPAFCGSLGNDTKVDNCYDKDYLLTKNISEKCYGVYWRGVGCTTDKYKDKMTDKKWYNNITGKSLIEDSAKYSSPSANAYHKKICRG